MGGCELASRLEDPNCCQGGSRVEGFGIEVKSLLMVLWRALESPF